MEMGGGKIAATALLKKVEADTTTGELMVGDIKKLKQVWDESYMKAFMKLEVSKLAAAKFTPGAADVASNGV